MEFVAQTTVHRLDERVTTAGDGRTFDFDLFLAVPVHRAPRVVEEAGMAEDGWVPVDALGAGRLRPLRRRCGLRPAPAQHRLQAQLALRPGAVSSTPSARSMATTAAGRSQPSTNTARSSLDSDASGEEARDLHQGHQGAVGAQADGSHALGAGQPGSHLGDVVAVGAVLGFIFGPRIRRWAGLP